MMVLSSHFRDTCANFPDDVATQQTYDQRQLYCRSLTQDKCQMPENIACEATGRVCVAQTHGMVLRFLGVTVSKKQLYSHLGNWNQYIFITRTNNCEALHKPCVVTLLVGVVDGPRSTMMML